MDKEYSLPKNATKFALFFTQCVIAFLFTLPLLTFAQESNDHHAQSDAYWASLAQSYPAFEVDRGSLRVAAANELHVLGSWGPILDWPHIPVSAAHLPDGRILTWASNKEDGFPGGQSEFTYAAAWDPSTEVFKMVPHNTHDMFCAHQVMLEDGRLMVMGGRNTVRLTSIYDYRTDTWTPQQDMIDRRWYPTSIALPSGEVMTAIGSGGSRNPEIWNELSGWRKLTGIDLNAPILNYTGHYERNWWPLFHVAPNGEVFHSGPTPDMHYLNMDGNGSITRVGPKIDDWYPKHGTTVMYDEGKILTAGGAIAGSNLASTNRAMTIDITGGTPVVTEIAPMAFARKFQNGIPLPTGEVLIVGGNTSGTKFSDEGSILTPELFNPDTQTWTQMADMAVPRNYHSVGLLMTDGRVWTGGGGLCGTGCAANHMDAQIFSPPYLFNQDGTLATRPSISSAPSVVRNGETFTISGTAGMTAFSMIKMSSTTHGVDSDVRFLPVSFTDTGAGSYALSMHANMNVLTPGYWMLFGINAQGVPSEAAIVQISTEGIPDIANPGTQISTEGAAVSLQIVATDSDGGSLSYTATGLPSGLSINGGTGLISGSITKGSVGTFNVTVAVNDGLNTVDAQFTWKVIPEGAGILSEYYEGNWTVLPNFDNIAPIKSEIITNFDISNRDQEDFFGFRFTGYINIETSGSYTFYTTSDDGSQLFINDNLVVDNDGLHGALERSGVVSLEVGYQPIEVTFFERGGAASLLVQYEGPGIQKQTIPEDRLFVAPPAPNNAPGIDAIADQINFKGEVISLQVSASDPDGDLISFSATGLPAGLSINGDGLISGTIEEMSNAENSVDVTVTDGTLASSISFDWSILTPVDAQGEIGTVAVEQSNGNQWHTVNLENTYSLPVVVMGPPSFEGATPLTTRVRNVGATSFEFQFDEWDYLDGSHTLESVSYMVIEAGSHQLADGRIFQAGFKNISGNGWNDVSFMASFEATPVVMTQVGTANDAAAVISRNRSVGPNGFQVQLEEEQGAANDHGQETVYWVAVAPGSDAAAIPNEAGVTGNEVTDDWHTITFSQTYSATPVFFGDFQTTDGGDPATMRYQSLTGNSIQIFAEEEKAGDNEISHTTEIAGFIVFNEPGPIPFDGFALPPIVLQNPGDQSGTEGEAVSLSIQVEQDNGAPLTFTASGLPTGLSMNPNGLISGGLVSGSAGSSSVTVNVTDGNSSGTTSFSWNIDSARGSWIDFTDDSNFAVTLTTVPASDTEEKDVAVGDLDRDGWDDIIVVRKEPFMGTGARPDLLLMNENGTFVDKTETYAPGFAIEPTIARDVIIADLDGDGWDDVLIATTFEDPPKFYRNLGADASGWLGLADESATRLPALDVGTIQFCSVTAGDVNGDNAPDLYFANYVMDGTTEDVLLINDGNGNFVDEGNERLGALINVAFGVQATIVDIDGDEDNDIVKLNAKQPAAPFGTDGIFILYNDGTGNFSNWSEVPSDAAYMYMIADYDKDEQLDFYVVDDGIDYVNLATGVTVNSNMTFSQDILPWARTAGHGGNLGVGDLDGDGDLDIGIADVDSSFPPCEMPEGELRAFLLLENEGSATGRFIDPFGAASKPWNKNIYDFAFVDANKDGNLDIFSAQCTGYALFTSTQDPKEPPQEPVTIQLGNLGLGIAAHDQRTGTGYLMYSEERVHDRFSATPPSIWAADHLIAVVFENGQWNIDRNKRALVPFTPHASDRLLVEVDFGANTVNSMVGGQTTIQGMDAGYIRGDLVVTPEMWAGRSDVGEFGVTGTEIVINAEGGNRSPVLTAIEDQVNYIDETASLSLLATDSDGDPVTFTAAGLPPGLQLEGNEITGLFTTSGIYSVTVSATDGRGGTDSDNFTWTVDGGDPSATITIALGDLKLGIAAHDQRTGPGYIMYSEESVHTRFADNPPSAWNADHLIAAVFAEGQWYIDRNKYFLVPFTPRSSDHLVATVDFGDDIVTHLQGVNTSVEGINAGFVDGDLVVTAEMWGGSPNVGEFGVEGTEIEIPGEAAQSRARGGNPQVLIDTEKEIPEVFDLSAIYPNPFSGTTTVLYHLPEDTPVRIEVFNITGQRIKTLINNANMPAGTWRTIWDGTNEAEQKLASGVYLVRLQAGGFSKSQKVVLTR